MRGSRCNEKDVMQHTDFLLFLSHGGQLVIIQTDGVTAEFFV
jgi:hypothetical protein